MKTFWDLLAESVIVQSLIALIVVSTVCYLYIAQKPIPSELLQILWLVMGFYFGAKTALMMFSHTKMRKEDKDD